MIMAKENVLASLLLGVAGLGGAPGQVRQIWSGG
jgi:hypothetical protein